MVAPHSVHTVQVSFKPTIAFGSIVERYELEVKGGNKQKLNLSGSIEAPTLAVSTSHIKFGNVKVGKTAAVALNISNVSSETAYFQFILSDGVFIIGSKQLDCFVYVGRSK